MKTAPVLKTRNRWVFCTGHGHARDRSRHSCQRRDTGSAIGDMLLLSRAEVFLASGSSFSAWASFLGQMPTLTHPGLGLTRLFGLRTQGAFLGEFDPANPIELRDLLSA